MNKETFRMAAIVEKYNQRRRAEEDEQRKLHDELADKIVRIIAIDNYHIIIDVDGVEMEITADTSPGCGDGDYPILKVER